jgi:hypothetical protein
MFHLDMSAWSFERLADIKVRGAARAASTGQVACFPCSAISRPALLTATVSTGKQLYTAHSTFDSGE